MPEHRAISGLVSPQLVILLLLVVVLSVVAPGFATLDNAVNIVKQASFLAIVSCGLTLVVVGGWLDLSVGSAFSLLGVMAVTLVSASPWAAVAVPILAGALIGVANGAIIGRFDANSIVVTLGSLSLVGGAAMMWTNGAIVSIESAQRDTWFSDLGQGVFLGVPHHVYAFILVAVVYEFLLRSTVFGRCLTYIGTNPEAARIAGVPVVKTAIAAFVLSGVAVAMAAVVQASRLSSAAPTAGLGLEFEAVTAIVIGGVSLRGGKGTVLQTLVGVFLLAVIVNGLTLFNVPSAFHNVARGLLILVAVLADVHGRRRYEA